MIYGPLRAECFTVLELAEALKADRDAPDGFCAVAPEQMRAIACAVWRHAAAEGLDGLVPGTSDITRRALALAVHEAGDLVVEGMPVGGGAPGRHVLFGAGAAQLAFIVEAVRVEGARERDERARLNGPFDPIGDVAAESRREALR